MTFITKQDGLLRSARRWGVLGLLLALAVTVGYGQGDKQSPQVTQSGLLAVESLASAPMGAGSYSRHARNAVLAQQPPPCVPPPPGLVAWWPLDGLNQNGEYDDLANFDNNGTPIGNPATITGYVGNSLQPGINKFVQVADAPNLNFGKGPFTIDAWVKPGQVPGPNQQIEPIVAKWDPQTKDGYFLFLQLGKLYFQSGSLVLAGPPVTSGWNFVAVVVNPHNNVIILYVGTGNLSSVSHTATINATNTQPLNIGLSPFNPHPNNIIIDEVEIFNRALDQKKDLEPIFNAGSAGKCKETTACIQPPSGLAHWWPLDETAGSTAAKDIVGGRDGTTKLGAIGSSGSPKSVAGKVGNAFEFDGSSAFVEVPDGPGTLSFGNPGQEFSIDAWIKVEPGDASDVRPIVDKRNEIGGKVAGYQLYLRDGKLSFQLADASVSSPICDVNPSIPSPNTSCTNYESTANVADGQWHLVAVTVQRTGTSPQIKLYVDGALQFTGPTRIHANNNASLLIGRNNPAVSFAGQFFKGLIDEVEIFNRVLDETEIKAIYNAGSAGKCKKLTFEICGVKWNDLDGDGRKDPNEPGLPGWTINMVFGTPPNLIDVQATTDANGQYCFTGLAPGTYAISEALQPGWIQTFPPTPGTYTVTVPPSVTNINFGNQQGKCDLEISKSLAHGIVPPLQPGQQVTFEIIVTNVGTGPCDPPIPVTDTFTGMTYQSGGQIMGPWTCPPGSSATPVTCNYSGTSATPLQPGQSSNFFVNFTVTAKPGEAVENCAEVKHPNDTNPNNNKACIKVPVAEPKEKCDLKITKTVQPNPVPSGQQVTVTLTVQNVGTGPCGPDTVVQDPPTTGLTVLSQQVGVSQSGGTATWGCLILGGGVNCVTASTLPVGYTATFTFTATVTVAPPPGGVANIQNCATVNNPNDPLNPANPGNNQSCVTLQVQGVGNPMDLALAKLLDGQLRVEQEVMYVLRVTNVGGRPTTGPIVVSDPLPSGLRFVSASGPGWSCAAQGQNVTCRAAGPIQPGQTSTILLRVRVAAPAGTQITNCATVETAGDANPANNRACHTSTVQR
jgi:uncharacterized repeat protein (TIGR01451 family)